MNGLKLMIVDDDQLIRDRLLEMIPLQELGLECCCEADNGVDAFSLYLQHRPQIILMDINIPLLNGLELARMIGNEEKNVRIIVITGYATLDSAREAIRANAFDFLTKPVRQDELLVVLRRAIDSYVHMVSAACDAQQIEKLLQESLPLLRERYLLQLLSNGTQESEDACRRHLSRIGVPTAYPYLCVAAVVPDYAESQESDREVMQIVIQNMTEEICRTREMASIVFFDPMQRGILLVQGAEQQLTKRLEELLILLQEKMMLVFHSRLSAGIGSTVSAFKALSQSMRDALDALNYKNTFGQNGICSIENVFRYETLQPVSLYPQMEDVFSKLQAGNQEAALSALKCLFGEAVRMAGGSEDFIRWIFVELVVRLNVYLYSRGMSNELPCLADRSLYTQILLSVNPFLLQRQIYDLFVQCLTLQKRQRRSRSAQLIERACTYIREHCGDPELDLSEASAAVELSSVYFSTLFKKETGMTFTDYLNSVRVERAKKLLQDQKTPMKMYEISEQVGYSNPKYFYQMFRRLTGQSPKQYAQSCALPADASVNRQQS